MSAMLALRDAVVALLLAAPALAGGFVKAGRALPLPAERAEGVFVRIGRNVGDAPFAGDDRVDWETEIVCQCVVRAAAGVDGEAAVDALVASVYGRLAAAPAPEHAEAWTRAPAIAFDVDEADQTIGSAELRIRVRHRTTSTSLTAST